MYLHTPISFPLYFCSSYVLSHSYCIIIYCIGNVSFIKRKDCQMYLHTHTLTITHTHTHTQFPLYFRSSLVLSHSYCIIHDVLFIKRNDCQMYLHTHNFPYIFVQAMSCPITTALLHNVLFIKRKDCQMYIPTHTISLIFSFKPCLVAYLLHYCIMFSSERKKNVKCTYTHTHTHHSHFPIFSFKQKLRKFPYKNFSFQ